MVRTFRNPQGGSLGGVFDGPQARVSFAIDFQLFLIIRSEVSV